MKRFIAMLTGFVALVSSFNTRAQAQEVDGEFIVMNCVAVNDHEVMDIDTGFWYDGFDGLEFGEYYRVPAFNAENPKDYDPIDIDTWETYLRDITEYEHDLTRVEICMALDNNSLVQSDDEVFCITDGTLIAGNLYYTFFDKNGTDEDIYDDRIIEIMPISEFDVEIFECNKMYMEENK